jgi:transcriptional regulator with XRE-family HTH domain
MCYDHMIIMRRTAHHQPAPNRIEACLLFATLIQQRREQLSLSIEHAAGLSGLRISEWYAVEGGWVPENEAVLHAIAETLEISWSELSLYAEISRYAQTDPV